jgi:hypothetical protein
MEGEDDVQSSALEFIFEPILSPVQLSWSALLLAARKQEKAEADDGRRAAARDA